MTGSRGTLAAGGGLLVLSGIATSPRASAAAIAAFLLCAVLAVAVRRPGLLLRVLLVYTAISSHLLAILYRFGVPAAPVQAGILLKDALAVILVAALLLRRRDARDGIGWAVPLTALILLGALNLLWLTPASPTAAAASVRSLTAPLLGLLAGWLFARSGADIRRFMRFFAVVMLVGGAYALIEAVLPPSFAAQTVGVTRYYAEIKQVGSFLGVDGLPANSFTSGGVRRLAGAFGDPLTAGYVLALGAVCAFVGERAKWGVALAGMALISFTRAAWVMLAIVALAAATDSLRDAAQRQREVFVSRAAIGTGLVSIVALGVAPIRHYIGATLTAQDGSIVAHLAFLSSGLRSDFSLLGSGFGTAGAAVAGSDAGRRAGLDVTESAYISALLSFGAVGLFLYLWLWLAPILKLKRATSPSAGIGVGLAIAIATLAVISEQVLTFNAGWPMGLVLGCLVGHVKRPSPAAQIEESALSPTTGIS